VVSEGTSGRRTKRCVDGQVSTFSFAKPEYEVVPAKSGLVEAVGASFPTMHVLHGRVQLPSFRPRWPDRPGVQVVNPNSSPQIHHDQLSGEGTRKGVVEG